MLFPSAGFHFYAFKKQKNRKKYKITKIQKNNAFSFLAFPTSWKIPTKNNKIIKYGKKATKTRFSPFHWFLILCFFLKGKKKTQNPLNP